MNLIMRNLRLSSLWAALFLVFSAGLTACQTSQDNFPKLHGSHVVDEANIISPKTRENLNQRLTALEAVTTDQIVIVTITSLDGESIEDYGINLGKHWGIGQSGKVQAKNGQFYKDNGILIILAPNERRVRIEVGKGLEGIITNEFAGQIISDKMMAYLKENDFDQALINATTAIAEHLEMVRQSDVPKSDLPLSKEAA